jgi:hypothetical protein
MTEEEKVVKLKEGIDFNVELLDDNDEPLKTSEEEDAEVLLLGEVVVRSKGERHTQRYPLSNGGSKWISSRRDESEVKRLRNILVNSRGT